MSVTIALVAHDAMKPALIAWAKRRVDAFDGMTVLATGTTGAQLIDQVKLDVTPLLSGPKGGDAQLGARIAQGELGALVFFVDAMTAMPHDVDVKSLMRLAILYNTPLAMNESTADAVLDTLNGGRG
jgi:methylglyoxal synthase